MATQIRCVEMCKHMPNLTISVPEKLKAEMETLSEVNWSEICRNAISRYVTQRKNPTPNIELDLRNSRITHYDFATGYPTLSIDLKIHNKMNSEITVDRILSKARFFTEERRALGIGSANDLRRRVIGSNSAGGATIDFVFTKEKITELQDALKSTFECHVSCMVFVDGFKNEYNQEVKAVIPIDRWNDVVKKALEKNSDIQVDR